MISSLFRLSIISLALFVISSCSTCNSSIPDGDGLGIVPADAPLIVAFNLPALAEKGELQNLQSTPFFASIVSQASLENPAFADIMRDPSKAGIDINQKLYFAYDVNPAIPNELMSTMVISLDDPALFEQMLVDVASGYEIERGSGYNFIDFGRLNMMAWDDHYLVFGESDLFINMQERMDKYFATTPSESIAQNPKLRSAMAQNRDISLWATTTPFAENPYAAIEAFGLKWISPAYFANNYIQAHLDFVDGAVELEVDMDFQESAMEQLSRIFEERTGPELLSMVPEKDVFFSLDGSLSMEGLYNVVNSDRTVRNWLQGFYEKSGFVPEDLIEAFGGHLAVTTYRPEGKPTTAAISLDVKDYERAKKIVALGVELGLFENSGKSRFVINTGGFMSFSFFQSDYPDGKSRLYLRDDALFISGNQTLMENFINRQAPKGQTVAGNLIDPSRSEVLNAFINMELMTSDEEILPVIQFQDMKLDAGMDGIFARLRFENEDINALKQVFDVIKSRDLEMMNQVQ
ncbi:MAG: DUF4836 family protein [Bacteroidetes bacterium]|nr:DUF4836 family protein [Bacteroidota bacterium]